jgi:NTP pyrophosphatase (non-canonical NTP hydrolase)
MSEIKTSFQDLRSANAARQKEWNIDNRITLAFRGNEMAGEIGEALEKAIALVLLAVAGGRAANFIKKIQRERLGLVGSSATKSQLAEELADIVICADLIANDEGIDLLGQAVPSKFNATSEKLGFSTLLSVTADSSRELQARIRTLEEALRPLAFVADLEHRVPPGESVLVNVDLCRDARTALGKEGCHDGL